VPEAGQLVNWRADSEGRSIKFLVRGMTMGTPFSESEAFALARKPEHTSRSTARSSPPRWATRRYENARALHPERREHDEKVAAASSDDAEGVPMT
jgi:hypothetical protein